MERLSTTLKCGSKKRPERRPIPAPH
jgi:hypothetical protein